MASTEQPDIESVDKYQRLQQCMTRQTRFTLGRIGRYHFQRSFRYLAECWEDVARAAGTTTRLHMVWKECLEQAKLNDGKTAPDEIFRQEIGAAPYCYMYLYTGGSVSLGDLFLHPVETPLWQEFLHRVCGDPAVLHPAVIMPFALRRSQMTWILSNDAALNSRLQQPLQAHIMIPSRAEAPGVLIMPLNIPKKERSHE